MNDDLYASLGANVDGVRNKNESRVRDLIPEVLRQMFPAWKPNGIDVEDIYALALNSLPPRYVQPGGIVLREPVGEVLLRQEIERAARIVRERPNH